MQEKDKIQIYSIVRASILPWAMLWYSVCTPSKTLNNNKYKVQVFHQVKLNNQMPILILLHNRILILILGYQKDIKKSFINPTLP